MGANSRWDSIYPQCDKILLDVDFNQCYKDVHSPISTLLLSFVGRNNHDECHKVSLQNILGNGTSFCPMLTHSMDCPKYVPTHPLCFCVLLSCVLFCVYIVSNRVFVVAVKIFIVEKIVLRRKKKLKLYSIVTSVWTVL